MHLYVELWKPKDRWLSMGAAARSELLGRLGPLMSRLGDDGVELLGFAVNDGEVAYRADFEYIGIWQMPNKELALLLEKGLIETGFHDCFEQINARGSAMDAAAVIRHMMESTG